MNKLGLSGDTITIDGNIITKLCQTNQERFVKNTNKQIEFTNPHVKAVPIIESGLIDGKNYIKMPFIRNANCLEWISKFSVNQLNLFIETIISYFNYIIGNSRLNEFDYTTWHNKINELIFKIEIDDISKILNKLKSKKFKNNFYYGNYHGDFNFSNLLITFQNEEMSIEAIDFLEVFIHSPMNDITKIRQDTAHLWTLFLMNEENYIDINKLIILMNYIDNKIKNFISMNDTLNEYYISFQILNLIRIMPYTKNNAVLSYLTNEVILLSAHL